MQCYLLQQGNGLCIVIDSLEGVREECDEEVESHHCQEEQERGHQDHCHGLINVSHGLHGQQALVREVHETQNFLCIALAIKIRPPVNQ